MPAAELFLDDELIEDFPDTLDGIEPVGGTNAWYHFETTFIADQETKRFTVHAFPAFGGDSTLVIDNVSVQQVGVGIPGDFDGNGVLDAADINLLSEAVRAGDNPAEFDLNADALVNQADREVWVEELRTTYFGDSNLDGEFNSSDFVSVFVAGEYEDGIPNNSVWETGDWNGDAEFNSSDFVLAFTKGGYEEEPRVAQAVPEPVSGLLLALGTMSVVWIRRVRRRVA